MSARKRRVLVVDDVVEMAQAIAGDLVNAGFEVDVATSGATALELFARDPADVVVTDLRMRPVDGLEVLDEVKRADPSVPVIVMTGHGAIESAVETMRRGAFHYLTKPFELADLRALVERASRDRAVAAEHQRLRDAQRENASARRLLGQSPPMRQLRALIERVADAQSPVLISGETGTGKELVALAIHSDGPRAASPFVAINCAALPEPLLESELFGHARGAFTGAAQARRGLFVEADGGTLFLDEVGDLPLPLQGKLLRVLQSGEVRPVGSETARHVDVRVIAATHKDLVQLVEQGQFREDLYFRLDVLRVRVPPLRERREDLPALIEHFLKRSLERSPRATVTGFEPAALDFLAGHRFPGNVRQLENLVERLVVTVASPLVKVADVEYALGAVRDFDPIAYFLVDPPTLEDLQKRYIEAVLRKTGGSKARAAEILGIDASTLYRREKQKG